MPMIPVIREDGNADEIEVLETEISAATFGNPRQVVQGWSELIFHGDHVNDIGDGRYEVVSTGEILRRA